MSLIEWPSGILNSTKPQSSSFLSTTTIGALSDTHSTEEKMRYIEQTDMTGRRSWKTMKGFKGEAVWPPNLEAALLEALERYHEHSWRPALGRFPMRNRFISDYIYETTGKRRTAKQVGSRLQQLKDTCKNKIRQLIIPSQDIDQVTEDCSTDATSSIVLENFVISEYEHRSPIIFEVNILLDKLPWRSPIPVVSLMECDTSNPLHIRLSSYHGCYMAPTTAPYYSCSCLPDMDPTIELDSPCPLLPQSTFLIFVDGCDTPIHTEFISLLCHSSPIETSSWVYTTSLVPGFWDALRNGADLTQYTIKQSIIPLRPLLPRSTVREGTSRPRANWAVTMVYRFCYSQSFFGSHQLPIQALGSEESSFIQPICDQKSMSLLEPLRWSLLGLEPQP